MNEQAKEQLKKQLEERAKELQKEIEIAEREQETALYNYCNSIANAVKELSIRVTIIQERQEQIIQRLNQTND